MLSETEAIILRTIKYSETSVIAHVYTEKFGKGSYLMNGVRKNRSKMAMFQPLSVVKIDVYRKKENAQIHRIGNIAFQLVPTSIPQNIYKSTIALFVSEITNHIFKEEEYNPDFFHFFKTFISILEKSTENYSNLHILYMIHLTHFLGVFPENNYNSQNKYFSVEKAQFVPTSDLNTLDEESSSLFSQLISTQSFSDELPLNHHQRQNLLSILLLYYNVHVCDMQNIKSLDVLKMVFAH
ncbi:MAG: DNA repair protein RecO [Bacteroidales bacterium]|nr:DNA repair protein RecO [Bacteroidales bacterium]